MEKILVTGGAGFIGSSVCDELLAKGKSVICLDNFENNYPEKTKLRNTAEAQKNQNFTLIRGDVRKAEETERIFAENRIDTVIHLAAKTGVRPSVIDPAAYFDTNVKGTINILNSCAKHKTNKIVFASSSSVYGSGTKAPFSEESTTIPDSPYGATKLAAEHMCRIYNKLHGLKITCLRFFTVYGPRGRPDMAPYIFTKKILDGEAISVFGDGTSKRDYTHITDITTGIMLATEKDTEFEIINLGNSHPIKLTEFIATIEKTTGKKARIEHSPEQQGDMKETCADIRKAEQILGYRPKTRIEQGMKSFAEWYKKCAE